MSTLPGDASPPKSGCSLRVPPLLTNAMKLDDAGSTGAVEMSTCHQLSAGNTGDDGGAPSTGTEGGHCARAFTHVARPSASAARIEVFSVGSVMPKSYDDSITDDRLSGGRPKALW